MTEANFPGDWLRGTLPYAVLGALRGEPRHGYAIAGWLKEIGLGDIKGGTLYPLLGRLERDGLVGSHWEAGSSGPGRKVFTLTEAGERWLAVGVGDWQRFSAALGVAMAGDYLPSAFAEATSKE